MFGLVEEVCTDAKRDRRVGVAKLPRNEHDIDTFSDQERRECVPEVMEPQARSPIPAEPGLLDGVIETSTCDVPLDERTAEPGDEDEVFRSSVTLRLAEAERAQIAAAAGRLKLTVSGFLRQSALEASAAVEEKAEPVRPSADVRNPRPMHREPPVLVDAESEHWVDGERAYW